MISDDGLYSLAVFLGSAAVLLIILYHFLEVNAVKESESDTMTGTTQADVKTGPVAR